MHFQSKFTKSANKSNNKKFLLKNLIWVLKNAEFHADFESVEKVLKKSPKKLLAKLLWKYALFSLLIMFVKPVLFITFLCIFLQLF